MIIAQNVLSTHCHKSNDFRQFIDCKLIYSACAYSAAHTVILSISSPVLETMFHGPLKEKSEILMVDASDV